MKKKIYKVLSLLLTFLIVFSACATALSTVSAATKTYYVKAEGDDANVGLSMSKALKTIGRAIEVANAAGLGAGDTVTVKTLEADPINWLSSGNQLPKHDFKLVITSNNATIGTIGDGTAVALGGETEFKIIKLNLGSSFANFTTNGSNVTFADATQIIGVEGQYGFNIGNTNVDTTYSKPISMVLSKPINIIGLGNINGKATFNESVDLTYNAVTGTPNFSLSAADGTTTFNSAMNLQIKMATSFAFSNTDKVVFGANGYMQIVNITSQKIAATDLPGIDTTKLLIINNELGVASLATPTEVKGKFAVDAKSFSNIKAINATNPSNIVEPVDGFLTLGAGVWNITAEKLPQKATYYVQANGIGDGTSEESPLSTVGAAIAKAISDGCIAGDEVTVKVIGSERVKFETIPPHAFKLIVTSNTAGEATVGDGAHLNMGGDTEFKYIKVYFGGDNSATTNKIFSAMGKNVTFGDGTSFVGDPAQSIFAIGASEGIDVYTKDFSIINRVAIKNFYFGAKGKSPVYDCNVNISYDSLAQSPIFNLAADDCTTTFNKALFLTIKSANSITFSNQEKIKFGKDGFFQIVNSSESKIIPADAGLTNVPADKLWVINNISGKNSLIESTSTKGVFKVKLDNPEHKVVVTNNATGKETRYDGANGLIGEITLEPATYTVTIDKQPEYLYYYVDPDNGFEIPANSTPPEGVGTEDNPVKTYADAIRLIAAAGLTNLDVATIYVPSTAKTSWGLVSEVVPVKPTIIIESNSNDQAIIETSASVGLSSNTILKNVQINLTAQYPEFYCNENSLTVDAGSKINSSRFYIWGPTNKKHVKDIDIIISGEVTAKAVYLHGPQGRHTSSSNINVVWDNPVVPCAIQFGNEGKERGVTIPEIYEGDITVTVTQAPSFYVSLSGPAPELKGKLNMIVNGNIQTSYSVVPYFDSLNAEGGQWYITNATNDNDFVTLTSEKGKFAIKDGATAYSLKGKETVVKHEGGTVDLSSASGAYIISDKKDITPINDNPEKMLYYKLGGGHRHVAQWADPIEDEVTYIFEYTIFSQAYNLSSPICVDDQRKSMAEVKVISDTLLGEPGTPGANFHKVVSEFTMPKGVNAAEGYKLFIGHKLESQDEGLILDRSVYRKDDPTKTNLLYHDANLLEGLNYITLNYDFWGYTFTGAKGGHGRVEWTDGYQELKVMDEDLSYSEYLIALNNPQDGEWWDEDDLAGDDFFETYANAKGFYKDQDGKGIKDVKFRLASDDYSYEAITNAEGTFDFGKIVTGSYSLYIVEGEQVIDTGFSSYFSQDDIIVFNIVSDMSGVVIQDTNTNTDPETDNTVTDDPETDNTVTDDTETDITDTDNIDTDNTVTDDTNNTDTDINTDTNTNVEPEIEIIPSGNLKGTVYTPNLETVKDLKIILRGIGEAVTDANGTFGFADIPVGDYELYTLNSDGSEYVLRTVSIKENINLEVKIKYAPPIVGNVEQEDNGWIIWVIVASVVALIVVGGLIFLLVINKKKN